MNVTNIGSGTAGIEGIKLFGCDFVGVDKGILLDNTHGGPGLNVVACHINGNVGISLTKINHVFISDTLFYCNGPISPFGIVLEYVTHASISNCQFYRVAAGNPYGVLCNNSPVLDVKVIHNHFELAPSGGETAIWLGNNSSRCQALHNTVQGLSAGYDVVNTGSNNVVSGNVKY